MEKEDINETELFNDRLGDEKRIRSILTDWGMDGSAIGRMLDEHQERQASARHVSEEQTGKVCPAVGSPVSDARLRKLTTQTIL